MDRAAMLSHILDAHPTPIVFADCQHIVRYMNKAAEKRYYDEMGFSDLLGNSLFDCHSNPKSAEMIQVLLERFQAGENEFFLKVSHRNERIVVHAVRDEEGTLLGYYEHFESNIAK